MLKVWKPACFGFFFNMPQSVGLCRIDDAELWSGWKWKFQENKELARKPNQLFISIFTTGELTEGHPLWDRNSRTYLKVSVNEIWDANHNHASVIKELQHDFAEPLYVSPGSNLLLKLSSVSDKFPMSYCFKDFKAIE